MQTESNFLPRRHISQSRKQLILAAPASTGPKVERALQCRILPICWGLGGGCGAALPPLSLTHKSVTRRDMDGTGSGLETRKAH